MPISVRHRETETSLRRQGPDVKCFPMNFERVLLSGIIGFGALIPAGESLCSEEGPIRIRDDFRRFHHTTKEKGKAHVAFLGGSITQNTKGHTAMIPEWLREQYPEAAIEVTNAGLSSTCSVTGAFRVAKDILAKGPVDLLVVEFAVNDDQDAGHDQTTATRGMEGIIQQVRQHSPEVDILMVHFVNPSLLEAAQAGKRSTSIAAHESVAEHWNLTTVNLAEALAAATASGEMDWKQYGGVHPNQEGYRFASDLMIEALSAGREEAASNAESNPSPLPEKPADPASYGDLLVLPLEQASWLGGWELAPVGRSLLPTGGIRDDYLDRPALRSDEAGAMLYLDFHGRALTAFVLAGPDAGSIEVSMDGGEWKPVSLFHRYSKGLNYPRTLILADDLSSDFHQAAIRIRGEKPEGSQGTAATFLQFSTNR